MIQKIEHAMDVRKKNYVFKTGKQITNNSNHIQNTIEPTPIDSKLLQNYYISFGAKKNYKQNLIEQGYSLETKDLILRAEAIAKNYGHSEINEIHIEKAALESLRDYSARLDSGVETFSLETSYLLPKLIMDSTTINVLKKEKERIKVKPVIEEEIKHLDEKLSSIPAKTI